LMAHFGYGTDYKYPHNFPKHFVEQNYLPEGLTDKIYYQPTENGYEKKVNEYLTQFWRKRMNRKTGDAEHEEGDRY